ALPRSPAVVARVSEITNTNRRTTLGSATTGVTLSEHVLAALAGLRIDNCTLELDGLEPPGFDGSAGHFAELLLRNGIVLQAARRPIWAVERPVILAAGEATIALHPADGPHLRATYILDYGLGSP